MLTLTHQTKVYLAGGATDMRKSIDGLAALVSLDFSLDPFDQSLFVFCNAAQDKVKILVWQHNGFWLYYRRLEKGRFRWPTTAGTAPMVISTRQLHWLLDGLELEQRKAHPAVHPEVVA